MNFSLQSLINCGKVVQMLDEAFPSLDMLEWLEELFGLIAAL